MGLLHYVGYPGAMIVTVHCRSVNTAVAVRRLHREGRIQKRKCKKMHAEHADGDRLNDLSGRGRSANTSQTRHRTICVFCVHPFSSALRSFSSCSTAWRAKRTTTAYDRDPCRATAGACSIGQNPCAEVPDYTPAYSSEMSLLV
jgi:hypothetical protein